MRFFNIEKPPNRIFGLDILRGSAILLVLIQHSAHFFPWHIYRKLIIYLPDGVTLFFVLSGYLIGNIIIAKFGSDEFNLSQIISFLKRRWLRTVPAYYFILSLIIILYLISGWQFQFTSISLYFLFAQNLWYAHPSFFPEAWSLPIEEWFYLLFPFLLFGFCKGFLTFKNSYILLVILILLASMLVRAYKIYEYPIDNFYDMDVFFRKQVISRMDSIAYGLLGAYVSFYYSNFWKNNKTICLVLGLIFLLLSSLIFIIPLKQTPVYFTVFSFAISSISFLLVIPFFSQISNGNGKAFGFFTFFSIISYSLYLVNDSLVTNIILTHFHTRAIPNLLYLGLRFILFWFFSITCALLLYKYVELPFMKKRR